MTPFDIYHGQIEVVFWQMGLLRYQRPRSLQRQQEDLYCRLRSLRLNHRTFWFPSEHSGTCQVLLLRDSSTVLGIQCERMFQDFLFLKKKCYQCQKICLYWGNTRHALWTGGKYCRKVAPFIQVVDTFLLFRSFGGSKPNRPGEAVMG